MVPPYEERLNRILSGSTMSFVLERKAYKSMPRLNGVCPFLTSADTYYFLDRGNENLSVADLTAMRGMLNSVDGAVEQRVLDHDLDLHLRQEIDDIFRAPIKLGMALLPAIALRLGNSKPLDANLVQGLLNIFKLERLDNR